MTRRRLDDHLHPEYWTASSQHRFEDRVSSEVNRLREDVEELTKRLTLMLGAIALLAFLLPIAAPFLRAWAGLEAPVGQ